MVDVRLFSVLREKVGADKIELDFEPGETAEHYLRALAIQEPALKPYMPFMRVAINNRYTSRDTPVSDGDTLSIITPVSGG